MANYGPFVLVLPVLAAFFFRKQLNKTLKLFLFYLIGMIVVNIVQQGFTWAVINYKGFWKPILLRYEIVNTHFFNILGIWCTFGLLGFFFSLILKNFIKSKYIQRLSILLCFFSLINHLFIEGFRSYGVIGALLTNLFVIFFTCSYLWYISHNPPNITYFKNPFTWICLSLFIYTLALLIFGFFADKIYNDDLVLFIKCQIGINCLNFLSQFAFAYAFYLSKYIKYLR